ncbi:phosphoribosylglycinamide formyltransferase [Thioalkalivibrio sp. HK1]|uniref:phosphoribosylglycinamide formyltransferase n=1 Tax=Thioalkalivibrio sp. HK1 TaxID=1469245 RepID=UPI0004B4C414|nr:phosphoribosylglycinamide formyltransferase [Thioalkalivibrio sp. HK1]
MTPTGIETPSPNDRPLAVVVLISGRGSNLQAIIDSAAKTGPAPFQVRAVISNEPGAPGLRRAEAAMIDTAIVDHRGFSTRQAFDAALAAAVDVFSPQLVVLAGFMRILGPSFVGRYEGRLINIHPSLLPAFPGLDTHARAIRAKEMAAKEKGDKKKMEDFAFHGASVHFVSDTLDAGPIIARARVAILDEDDPSRLAERVLEREHHLLPLVIRWFAAGRLRIDGSQVLLDDLPALTHPEAPI